MGEERKRHAATSLYLHVLQAREQRLVRLTHLLLVPPHVFQCLLNLLLFPLGNGEKLGMFIENGRVDHINGIN